MNLTPIQVKLLLDGKNEIDDIIHGTQTGKNSVAKTSNGQQNVTDVKQLFSMPGFKISPRLKQKMTQKVFGGKSKTRK